jgi:uncharacterized protein YcfJ
MRGIQLLGGNMKSVFRTLAVAGAVAFAAQAYAQVTFYEDSDFRGRSITANGPMYNFDRAGFNDRASSAIVRGGEWQVCEDARFEGRCVTLRPGNYRNFANMGINDQISSVRPVGSNYGNYGPPPAYAAAPPAYAGPPPQYAQSDYPRDYQRRHDERTFEVPVSSVRAVVGPPEQRCWVEQQTTGSNNAVPGAIAGAVIGGIIGHQIGSGRGRDVATGVGAVAGGAAGAGIGSNYGGTTTQDVQRCAYTNNNQRPDYYDVSYNFRGYEHHVQMTAPPGPTILVNENGEPRS